jgi:hypothetical protein
VAARGDLETARIVVRVHQRAGEPACSLKSCNIVSFLFSPSETEWLEEVSEFCLGLRQNFLTLRAAL